MINKDSKHNVFMDIKKLEKILEIMEKEAKRLKAPVFQKEKVVDNDAFKIVVFAVLSTRTKDKITIEVCRKLFRRVKNWKDLVEIDLKELEKIVYGIGFYRNKAKILKKLAREIIEKYGGKIPEDLKELTKLPGIGNKVAKVILSEVFNIPCIAVDTHVHRISNRIGIIRTKNLKESEEILEKIISKNLKSRYNKILVSYGQTICLPKKPLCKKCKIRRSCKTYD
ncbi:MAG: endonuclease III [Candidatus Aenigmatarchaeota archaeon]